MKRRVIEQGGITPMISLPRTWAKKFRIMKGDELEISERGKELILSTPKAIESEETAVIEIKDSQKFMGRLIFAPYRFGYNSIEIKYSDPAVALKIQKFLEQLLGFEIIQQGHNFMKIEMVAKELEGEFEKMLRRILYMTAEMAKELSKAAKENNNNKFKDIASMEIMSNKLTNFCERLLNKHGYTEVGKTSFMYCTVWTMEQIADDVRAISLDLADKNNISPNIIHFLEMLAKHTDNFTKIFYKNTSEDLWKFRQNQDEILKKLNKTDSQSEFRTIANIKSIIDKLKHLSLFL